MPNQEAPVQLNTVDLDQGKFEVERDKLEKDYALTLVNQTYATYENFRTRNHDNRWSASDSLYTGFVASRVWEGSNVPRANVSHKLVFDHVEAAIPSIHQAIFGLGDEWYSVMPEGEARPEDARKVKKALGFVVQNARDDYGGTAEMQIGLAVKDILLYGNGGIAVEWNQLKKRPEISRVDLRDIYIDPSLSDPSTDRARSIIRKRLMTVAELIELRDDSRMEIPSDSILQYLAKTNPSPYGDQTKATQEAYRGVNYQPASDNVLPNASNNYIEVLVYYSMSRIIWVLGRQWVAYNGKNPYNFFPFCFAPCFVFPNRWYALSFADVLEDKQKSIEGLFNGHLDEVALALNPPRSQAQNNNMTPNRRAWAPGMVFNSGSNDPSKAVALLQPSPVTTNVMSDISFLEIGAEKSTGINAVGQGIPRPGNANRTATGMNSQLQGSASRLSTIVKNIEDYLMTPLLYKIYLLLRYHVNSFDKFASQDNNGVVEWIDGGTFRQPVNFKMLASSKMVTRDKLMQIFPFLTQYLMSGPFMQGLNRAGQTVDFAELFKFMQDASGVEQLYTLIRPLSPEEQQALQQPDPQSVAADKKTQMDSQTRMGVAQLGSQTALEVARINNAPDPQADEGTRLKLQMETQAKQEELAAKREEAMLKIQLKQEEGRIKGEAAQIKMQSDAAATQSKLGLAQAEGQLKLQAKQLETESNLQNQQLTQAFAREAESEKHQRGLAQGEEGHQAKLSQMKQMATVKPSSGKKAAPAKGKSSRPRV